MRASRNEISAFPLYDCQGIDLRIGARGSSETENFKGYVYGSVIVIVIRSVDPGNRNGCDLLHCRGVVSDAGHFVDAAGGYSDVDTCCAARFVAGTCALRFVRSRTKLLIY